MSAIAVETAACRIMATAVTGLNADGASMQLTATIVVGDATAAAGVMRGSAWSATSGRITARPAAAVGRSMEQGDYFAMPPFVRTPEYDGNG